jgi:hypothetical protein
MFEWCVDVIFNSKVVAVGKFYLFVVGAFTKETNTTIHGTLNVDFKDAY